MGLIDIANLIALLIVLPLAILWLLLGLVTVIIAWRKKRSLVRWFLYALLAAPVAFGHVL